MLTPLDRDGGVDHARFAPITRSGCSPRASTASRRSARPAKASRSRWPSARPGSSALLAAGIPAQRVVAATGCAALTETIALTRHGVQSGCAACLVLPPFFFKDVSDDGLLRLVRAR